MVAHDATTEPNLFLVSKKINVVPSIVQIRLCIRKLSIDEGTINWNIKLMKK